MFCCILGPVSVSHIVTSSSSLHLFSFSLNWVSVSPCADLYRFEAQDVAPSLMDENCSNSIKVKLSSPRRQQTRRGSRWRVTCCAAPALLILPSGNKRVPVGEAQSQPSSAASSAGQEKCREQKLVNIHIICLDAFLHRGRLQVGRRRAFLAHRRAAFSGVTNSTIGCASWVSAGSAQAPPSAAMQSPALRMRPGLGVRKRPVWVNTGGSEKDGVPEVPRPNVSQSTGCWHYTFALKVSLRTSEQGRTYPLRLGMN